MTPLVVAIWMIVLLLMMIVLRAPIALAMGLSGAIGYAVMNGFGNLLSHMQTAMVDKFVSYELSVVPMFILMGQIATHTGMSRSIFSAANRWIGHLRGGLAMASVVGCAVFGAICGSSVATASTMAKVALPEMKRHGYSGALSSGSLAAGGTLGILIPPSIVLIIYALLTEQNIKTLFIAATIPGLLAVGGFIAAIAVYSSLYPSEGPVHSGATLRERLFALLGIWHVVIVFAAVLGGIYFGGFSPTEGASVGVALIIIFGLLMRKLDMAGMKQCIQETAITSAMLFAIIFGADLFNSALALTRMPNDIADWVGALGLTPMTLLVLVIIFYLVMGCVMDSISMILLTVPVFFPIMMGLDFGMDKTEQALWFGIITLIVVELGMITPPVGLNLFVISAMAPDISLRSIFRGAVPFIIAEFVRIGIIVSFPILTVWLTRIMV